MYFKALETGGGLIGAMVVPRLDGMVGAFSAAAILSAALVISLLLILDTSLSRLIGLESLIFKTLAVGVGFMLIPLFNYWKKCCWKIHWITVFKRL